MRTVEIPAAIYDEALQFCNDRLVEKGKPTITKLPPGQPHNPNSCPCGVATGVYVGCYGWWPSEPAFANDKQSGYAPTKFVVKFDELAGNPALKSEKQEVCLPIRVDE